jgi:hypothetical protein
MIQGHKMPLPEKQGWVMGKFGLQKKKLAGGGRNARQPLQKKICIGQAMGTALYRRQNRNRVDISSFIMCYCLLFTVLVPSFCLVVSLSM